MTASPSHILVYSGHLTDAPERAEERFPEAKAAAVRRYIDAYLEKWRAGPDWLAIGGAARGSDLLFVEACQTRGMDVAIHLALPPAEFAERSVSGGAPEARWEERFRGVVDQRDGSARIRIMPADFADPDENVFAAANRWMLETAAGQARRAEVRVMAVWDERPGDGGGGTENFLEGARRLALAHPQPGKGEIAEYVVVLNPLMIDKDPYAVRRHRISRPGPKRILALDGGGIRGALTLGFLTRIEALLRDRTGRPDLVLRDYFDLIGGTSTGAIMATGLAVGMSTAELRELYSDLGPRIFGKRRFRQWRSKYSHAGLSEALAERLGDRRLSDPLIDCGLCIVAKRADTRSTWPLHNHPDGRYFDRNGDILLRTAVRASTAAPTYFEPERVVYQLGEDGKPVAGAFVDGGVSMMNNPALQMLLLATVNGYAFRWPLGQDKLLLVSVGTGQWDTRDTAEDVLLGRRGWQRRLLRTRAIWDWAIEVPTMLMDDASALAQTMLQLLSASPTAGPIDREIGDLTGDWQTEPRLLSYLRYNATLTDEALAELGVPLAGVGAARLRRIDAADTVDALYEIGSKAALGLVDPAHFARAFDVGG